MPLLLPVIAATLRGRAWEETIKAYLDTHREVTVGQLAKETLGLDSASRLGTADRRRVTSILERLGWNRGKKDWKGRISPPPKAKTAISLSWGRAAGEVFLGSYSAARLTRC
jgi:hypothetical protein